MLFHRLCRRSDDPGLRPERHTLGAPLIRRTGVIVGRVPLAASRFHRLERSAGLCCFSGLGTGAGPLGAAGTLSARQRARCCFG